MSDGPMEQDGGIRLGWFVAGIAVGAAVGMLLAPKSGSETRDYIADKAGQGKDAVAGAGRDIFERSKQMYDKGREIADDAAELFERGRRLMRGEAAAAAQAPEAAAEGGPAA